MDELTDMQVVCAALFDALHSGLTLADVCEASRHADCVDCFDEAISLLGIGAIDTERYAFVIYTGTR